jgi:chitobiase/beta-hexosaminidase-like protein
MTIPFLSRRRTAVVIAALTAAMATAALAYWTTNSAAGSKGAAAAASVNGGATPSVSVTAIGREVSVSWGASTLSNGAGVTGYHVERYPSGGGVGDMSPIGTCSGTVAGTSCTEDDVPPGAWVYTVTPVLGNWHGAASSSSGLVTIGAATLALSGSPFGDAAFTPATANATGTISGFSGTGSGGHGENVSYSLDGSTPLTGSPTSVGTSGAAAIISLGIPKIAGDGAHTVTATGDAAYHPSQASTGIVIDTAAPTVTAQLSPSPNAAGWNNTTPVSVTLSANDGSGSGVNQIKYTTDGSDPKSSGTAQVYGGTPFTIAAQGTTTVKFYATDIAGNASSAQAQAVRIDTTPPTNSVSLTNVTGGLYPTSGPLADGTTVYYRGAAAGSFTIRNAVADALSGPASSATSSLAGGSGGWSHISSLLSTPVGGPYVSNTFIWSAGASSSPADTVTGRDVADNFASTTLDFVNDSTGPTGGSVDATGLGGAGGRYSTSTTLSIAFSKGTDSGSGLAPSGAKLLRASATLSSSDGIADGSCGSYGGFAQIGADDPSSPVTDDATNGIATGHCYRYEYVVSDRVGNTTTYTSPDIKVDTSGPSAPSVSLSSATGNTYITGSTVYINAQAGKSGSFQASATSTDGDSGIQKLNFPTLTGFSSGGGDDTSSPYSSGTYNWTGAVAASGAQTVTASNNANLTNNQTFTLTPDTTNPTGGALTTNGTTATSGGSTSTTSDPTYAINTRTNYSDSGSGLASSTLTVQSETLTSNSTCGAAGSGGPYTSPTTISGTSNPAITVGYCYRYVLTGTDNVGNTTSISTTVKVTFAGIDWTNITTSNNKTVSCNYTTITAVTCSVSGVGSGGTFTAKVGLIDANHNTVANTTGSAINVTQTTTGQGTGSPGSTTIAQNASASTASFTVTLNNGNGKTATITASITVNGVTYTVNCAVST